jgi:hypothetical protein
LNFISCIRSIGKKSFGNVSQAARGLAKVPLVPLDETALLRAAFYD